MNNVTHPQTVGQIFSVFYSYERSITIQDKAAAALEEERFNFDAVVKRFRGLLPVVADVEKPLAVISAKYCDEHADDVFYFLLSLFSEDKLSFKTEQFFLAALEAGLNEEQ